MASKRQLYDRASEIQDKIKSAHLRQREIVQELTKFKSLNFEQLRWMEKPFFEIALSFQYEYATMGMDSGYPTPLPAGKAYPGQDGTFLATNLAPLVRDTLQMLTNTNMKLEAQRHVLNLFHVFLRLFRDCLDLFEYEKSHIEVDRKWSPSLLTFLLWQPAFTDEKRRLAEQELNSKLIEYALYKSHVFDWLITHIVPDIRRETEARVMSLHYCNIDTPLHDLWLRTTRFFGTFDPTEKTTTEVMHAGPRDWLKSKYGTPKERSSNPVSNWVNAVFKNPISVALEGNSENLNEAASAWTTAAKTMFTNVISYARSKNFQTELEKSNRRDQLYIARVYLPFLEVIYVQLSVGANILCRVAEQKQLLHERLNLQFSSKSQSKLPSHTILQRQGSHQGQATAAVAEVADKNAHQRMTSELHYRLDEYEKRKRELGLSTQEQHHAITSEMSRSSAIRKVVQAKKAAKALHEGKVEIRVKNPSTNEAIHDSRVTASVALKRLLHIGESDQSTQPLHERKLPSNVVIPTQELISHPVELMEFCGTVYNTASPAGREQLDHARVRAAMTSWPVTLYHDSHVVGTFDIAAPWNDYIRDWDYRGLEALNAAIFMCLQVPHSPPPVIIMADWLHVKPVERATATVNV